MEAALTSAFVSNLFKTFWDPILNGTVGGIKEIIFEFDASLHKVEKCRDEALDIIYKINPSCSQEAKKLIEQCWKANHIIEDIAHEIMILNPQAHTIISILKSPPNWIKPHKLKKLHIEMDKEIKEVTDVLDFCQKMPQPFSEKHDPEQELIGRNDDMDIIVKKLLGRKKDDGCGVSIVGMRGVGKTALADHILKLEQVQVMFPLILRASMSGKKFCEDDLTSSLLVVYDRSKFFKHRRYTICDRKTLIDRLKSTQWLLMLDDLVEAPVNALGDFVEIYVSTGRKLLITSPSPQVGKLANTTVHNLMPLSNSDCEDLISYKLCSLSRFEQWRGEKSNLAMKSYGLPLVAKFMVRSLQTMEKGSHHLHESSLRWPNFEEEILPVLKSSLLSLEIIYKRCFVYFSLFPHDYLYFKEDLVLLWIGMRLIQPYASKFDFNGHGFFKKLLEKSIIQPHSQNNGQIRYELHKFFRDIAQVLGSNIFVRIDDECSSSLEGCGEYTRYLSLPCTMQDNDWKAIRERLVHLRTLFLLHNSRQNGQINKIPDNFFKKVCKLRVLSLKSITIEELPSSIKKLKFLRYLDIAGTNIDKIPELPKHSLQILKLINGLNMPQLPANFTKLSRLAYIDWDVRQIRKMKSNVKYIGKLINLRTLPLFKVGKIKGFLIDELRDMNHIEGSITIVDLENVKDGQATEAMLSRKSSLQRLELVWAQNASNAQSVLRELKPHHQLKELKIENYSGTSFPQWLSESITNLQKLELLSCQSCCNLPPIGQLSNLVELYLGKLYSVRILDRSIYGAPIHGNKCFHSLHILELNDMEELQCWEGLEANIMPRIELIKIVKCPKLKSLPSLCHHTKLDELHLKECSCLDSVLQLPTSIKKLIIADCDLMKNRCQYGGEDWSIIQHIPYILVDDVKMVTSQKPNSSHQGKLHQVIDDVKSAVGRLF